MKTRSKQGHRRFQLEIRSYGNSYYIERVVDLETALARNPGSLQLDMIGVGEISADAALRIRAALMTRSPKTQIITNARSSLQGGSVLVWLMGDKRMIRDDATLFFRRANQSGIKVAEADEIWNEDEPKYCDSFSETDPEEGDYVRVLQVINEFLPVKELAGRLIGVAVLRQFGLVENEQVDRFLADALGRKTVAADRPAKTPESRRVRKETEAARARQAT